MMSASPQSATQPFSARPLLGSRRLSSSPAYHPHSESGSKLKPDHFRTRALSPLANELPLPGRDGGDKTSDIVRATPIRIESARQHVMRSFSDSPHSVGSSRSYDSSQPQLSFTLPRPTDNFSNIMDLRLDMSTLTDGNSLDSSLEHEKSTSSLNEPMTNRPRLAQTASSPHLTPSQHRRSLQDDEHHEKQSFADMLQSFPTPPSSATRTIFFSEDDSPYSKSASQFHPNSLISKLKIAEQEDHIDKSIYTTPPLIRSHSYDPRSLTSVPTRNSSLKLTSSRHPTQSPPISKKRSDDFEQRSFLSASVPDYEPSVYMTPTTENALLSTSPTSYKSRVVDQPQSHSRQSVEINDDLQMQMIREQDGLIASLKIQLTLAEEALALATDTPQVENDAEPSRSTNSPCELSEDGLTQFKQIIQSRSKSGTHASDLSALVEPFERLKEKILKRTKERARVRLLLVLDVVSEAWQLLQQLRDEVEQRVSLEQLLSDEVS